MRRAFNGRRAAMVSALVTVVLAVAGCSNDSGGDGSSGSSKAIELYQIIPIQSPTFAFPDYEYGAQEAVDRINEAGGINGRDLKLTTCDDEMDQQLATQCAQKAVDSEAVAVVSSVSPASAVTIPILEAAGMATFGASPVSAIDTTSKVAFPLNVGPYLYYGAGAASLAAAPEAKTAVVIISDSSAAERNRGFMAASAKASGLDVLEELTIPAKTTDFSSILAKIQQLDPDALVTALSEGDIIKLWNAEASAGVHYPMSVQSTGITPDVIKSGGKTADGTVLMDSYPDQNDSDTPGATDFAADMEKAGKEPTSDAFRGWVGVTVLGQILQGMDGDITRETVLKELNAVSNLDALFYTGIDFTHNGPIKEAPRITQTKVYLRKVVNGQLESVGDPVDVASVAGR